MAALGEASSVCWRRFARAHAVQEARTGAVGEEDGDGRRAQGWMAGALGTSQRCDGEARRHGEEIAGALVWRWDLAGFLERGAGKQGARPWRCWGMGPLERGPGVGSSASEQRGAADRACSLSRAPARAGGRSGHGQRPRESREREKNKNGAAVWRGQNAEGRKKKPAVGGSSASWREGTPGHGSPCALGKELQLYVLEGAHGWKNGRGGRERCWRLG
jgi:hypothetical protein